MKLFALTVDREIEDGQNELVDSFTTPEVRYILDEAVDQIDASESGNIKVKAHGYTYEVIENADEIAIAMDDTDARNIANLDILVEAGLDPAGTDAGTATDVGANTYLVETDEGTVDSADGIQLPAGAVEDLIVLINHCAFALEVWPQTGEAVGGEAVDDAYSLAVGARVHLYCKATGVWTICPDNG